MNQESQPHPTPQVPSTLILAVGFLIGAVVVGVCWLSSGAAGSRHSDTVHNVTVDYMYETSPGSASGNNDLEVDSIQFFPDYIVMTDTRGRTQILALSRLRKFSYRPSKEE